MPTYQVEWAEIQIVGYKTDIIAGSKQQATNMIRNDINKTRTSVIQAEYHIPITKGFIKITNVKEQK